jgi:hypothetical protein
VIDKVMAEHEHELIEKRLKRRYPRCKLIAIRAVTWGARTSARGCICLPKSCSNLAEFRRKGIILFWHDPREPLGLPVKCRQDALGLTVWAAMLDTPFARRIFKSIRDRSGNDPMEASINVDADRSKRGFELVGGERVEVYRKFALGPAGLPEVSIGDNGALNYGTMVKAL